jgi:hypothetical protein
MKEKLGFGDISNSDTMTSSGGGVNVQCRQLPPICTACFTADEL